jgi:hypothetical protein
MNKIMSNLNLSGWERAIWDAERGIERLQAAIRVFKRNLENGEPWPGSITRNPVTRGNSDVREAPGKE